MQSKTSCNHWLLRVQPAFVASFLKKVLRIRRHMISTQEGIFFIDPLSNFGYVLSSEGGYEPGMTAAVKQILRNGDIFLDVGANEGYFL